MMQLWDLFGNLVVISLIAFGGAQPLLEDFAVNQTGWLTTAEFSSGLALAYTTPGPSVLLTPVFIGYKIAGVVGSFVGLLGIFIVPMVLAGLATRHLERLLISPLVQNFEKGARAALVGLLLITTGNIFETVEGKWLYSMVVLIAFVVCLRKMNPALVLLGGAVVGMVLVQ